MTKLMEKRPQNQVTNLFLSATTGGLLGVAAALLLAPKSGHKLRKQLMRTIEDLSDKGQDLAEDVYEKGQNAMCSAADYAGNIRNTATGLINRVSNSSHRTAGNLLIGAIGGGILGAATALWLAARMEEEEEGITEKIRHAGRSVKENIQSADWLDTAKDFMDAIKSRVYHGHNGSAMEEEDVEEGKGFKNALEWAALGLRLWQNIKKKR